MAFRRQHMALNQALGLYIALVRLYSAKVVECISDM